MGVWDWTEIMAKSKSDKVCCRSWQEWSGMVRMVKRTGVRHGKNVM